MFFEQGVSLAPVLGLTHDLKAFRREQNGQGLAYQFMVVYDQDL